MRYQRGAGIVEAIIGATLGLFIAGAMAAVYVTSAQSFRVREAHARITDAGAMALDMLRTDLRMAGMQGCSGDPARTSSVLNSSTDPRYNYAEGVGGHKADAGGWTPGIPAYLANGTPVPIAGSDILIVRRPIGVAAPLGSPLPDSATDPLVVDAVASIPIGSLAMVSDCQSAVVFQVTDILENPANGNGIIRTRLSHDAGAGEPGNAQSSLGTVFGSAAEVRRVSTLHYFVAQSSARAGSRSLWRVSESGTADEVAEGVEALALRFSLDTDGDGMADRVTDAAGVVSWLEVLEVQMSIVVSSLEDNLAGVPQSYLFAGRTITPTDRRLRRVYFSAATVRNRAR